MSAPVSNFLIKNGDTDHLTHVPLSSEVYGSKFRCACKCGYLGAERLTASHAYGATTVHANHANDREANPVNPSDGPAAPTGASLAPVVRPAATPYRPATGASAAPRRASAVPPAGRERPCGCGCPAVLPASSRGLFRPGHDAKFKGILKAAHQTNQLVRHPETAEMLAPLVIGAWLDVRRGGGTVWQTIVSKTK